LTILVAEVRIFDRASGLCPLFDVRFAAKATGVDARLGMVFDRTPVIQTPKLKIQISTLTIVHSQ
jgi:hypothetical protein